MTLTSSATTGERRLTVTVDDTQGSQRFWGVGASITGASAQLLSQLPDPQRRHALAQLFSRSDGIGLSVLRQPLGANDFSVGSHTYDDVPRGAQDRSLNQFSLGRDEALILPLVRQAQQLNPSTLVVASPWSAPAWMKSSGSLVGGTLNTEHYDVYARYLARAVQAYIAAGVRVSGVTLQNEPSFSPPGYPGMTLSADQQRVLVTRHLKPALYAAGLGQVGIWALDDNFDRTGDAEQLVKDPGLRPRIAGVAFHCYHGDVSAMKDFHARHPGLPLAISECTGGGWSPNFSANLRFAVETLLINGIRDGASWVSEWNAALDPSGGPTNGGCTNCRGLITIHPDQGSISYNEAFYAFGHLGKFVTPGAQVVSSSTYGRASIETVAFRNPDGSHVLLALNAAGHDLPFRVSTQGRSFESRLAAGAAATFSW